MTTIVQVVTEADLSVLAQLAAPGRPRSIRSGRRSVRRPVLLLGGTRSARGVPSGSPRRRTPGRHGQPAHDGAHAEAGRPPSRWGYLGNLYVHPDHRRRGIATLLVEAVLAHAAVRGPNACIVHPNERSLTFWRRSAFGEASDLLVCQLT